MNKQPQKSLSSLKLDDIHDIIMLRPKGQHDFYLVMALVSIVLTPITLIGLLIGYTQGHNLFVRPIQGKTSLSQIPPMVKLSMAIWAVLIWFVLWGLIHVLKLMAPLLGHLEGYFPLYMCVNIFLTVVALIVFYKWRIKADSQAFESSRFGTARFAVEEELQPYRNKQGLYLGEGLTFSDKGHVLLCGGTRSGKGVNVIIPNLLGAGGYNGSWCVIDPKGENAAITANYQRKQGKKVIIINPWGLLEDKIGSAHSFNPLDILIEGHEIHWIDDIMMIAEMLVPMQKDDKNAFFTDNARAIIAGLLLHIVTSKEKNEQTLHALWALIRLEGDDWDMLIAEMATNFNAINGEIVRNSANEIKKLMAAGEETFGSILSTALQCTDFLKSPSLKKSLQSDFDPRTLSDGNTVLYIVTPVDKLQSHSRWLRLLVTCLLRSVVRTPKEKVCFLLDEFISLGYLPEIERVALATFAGFNLTLFMVIQSLNQLVGLYGQGWETFIGNSTVRLFTGVNDNFTADYISTAAGGTSNVSRTKDGYASTARPLITPDEIRRASGDNMFAFLGGAPVTYFEKKPYYKIEQLISRADKNPYIKN